MAKKMSKQEIWDDIIIRGWFSDVPMWMCIEQMRANGIDMGSGELGNTVLAFSDLLRAPTQFNDVHNKTARTFIGVTMPWLSNYLWKYFDKDPTEFIKKLSAADYTIEPQTHRSREKNANRHTKQRRFEQCTKKMLIPNNPVNDWGLVKTVRSANTKRY